MYGSEGIWGHQGMFNLLKNYHEVICISGHSHYSLRNTKSIWQGDFTVVNTQSIGYVDLDNYFRNLNFEPTAVYLVLGHIYQEYLSN